MHQEVYHLPASYQKILDHVPDPLKVRVTLLDWDNLPLACGSAVLPLLMGVGMFWPSCPMPDSDRLASAKCFALATGETLSVRALTLCTGTPPHYQFWVNPP
jgi:hypothetical protein